MVSVTEKGIWKMGIMDAVLGRIVAVRMRSAGYDERMVALRREAAMAVRPDPAAYAVSHEKLWDEAGKPILDAIVSGVRPSPLVFDQAQIDVLSPLPGTGDGPIARLRNSVSEKDGRRRAVLVALSRLMESEPAEIEGRMRGAFPDGTTSAVLPTILRTREFRAGHGKASAEWILAARRLRTAEAVHGQVAGGDIPLDRGIVLIDRLRASSISVVEEIARSLSDRGPIGPATTSTSKGRSSDVAGSVEENLPSMRF